MQKLPEILFVDDDVSMCNLVQLQMDRKQFAADFVHSASAARKKLVNKYYDLAVLDLVMPGTNGIELARQLKSAYPLLPVLFLTAQSELKYKIAGFEAGADDYIPKPFNITELFYRIKAILRRSSASTGLTNQTIFRIGVYVFDSTSRSLTHNDKTIVLSQKEAELLHLLCLHINTVVNRDEFLRRIWGKTDEFTVDSMDVYITRLRKHLKDDGTIKIENLRGTGFKLVAE